MKRILLASLAISLCLSTGVYAKGKGGGSSHSSSSSKSSHSGSSSKGSSSSSTAPSSNASEKGDQRTENRNAVLKEDPTVKGTKVKEEIQDKMEKLEKLQETQLNPAELKAYADLLRKELSGVDKAEKQDLLQRLVETYEEAGDVEQAIDVQEEAVQSDLNNVEGYKKLGRLYEKNGQKGVKAFVNGKQPNFDVPPVIRDGRTLIPIRAISQSLKAKVNWDADTKTITITRDDVEIQLTLDENKMLVNGEELALDVPAGVINGRTVVPARFISEAFGALVNYEPETQSVIIVDETTEETTEGSTEGTADDASSAESNNEETSLADEVIGEDSVQTSDTIASDVQESAQQTEEGASAPSETEEIITNSDTQTITN